MKEMGYDKRAAVKRTNAEKVLIPLAAFALIGDWFWRVAPHMISLVCGLIFASLTAFHVVPYAYAERGYQAIGGEWLLVIIALIAGYRLSQKVFEFLDKEVKR